MADSKQKYELRYDYTLIEKCYYLLPYPFSDVGDYANEHEARRQKLIADAQFLSKLSKDIETVFGKTKVIYQKISKCIELGYIT